MSFGHYSLHNDSAGPRNGAIFWVQDGFATMAGLGLPRRISPDRMPSAVSQSEKNCENHR
jgi:hypothetical protein